MNKPKDMSFKFGFGETPPVLAGREKEKAAITTVLERLRQGASPGHNIALIGPRGNGKTALLQWAETQVGRCNGEVRCANLDIECFKSRHDLVGALEDPGALSAIAGKKGVSLGITTPVAGIEFSREEAPKKSLRSVLEDRCSEGGLAILIDEAHTLNDCPGVARAFFNDVQMLVRNGRPLLLVLAGTPNITPSLNEINASFWERLNKIGIGLLDNDSAREALQIPLEAMGFRIEPDILDKAANEAQRYPYFLQIVGDALHRAADAEPGNEIGDTILNRALTELLLRKNNYYSGRYRELRRSGILRAAEAVARRFVSQKENSIRSAALEVAIEGSIDRKMKRLAKKSGWIEPAAWVEARLRDVGFVWSHIGHEEFCEPGIPSLMDYVVAMADERENERRRIRESTRPDPASG